MNHTPGPWRQFTSPENSWIGNAETGEIVADRPNISTPLINARRWNNNAEFIITACNAHKELLEVLKELVNELEICREWGSLTNDHVVLNEPLTAAKKAIAKAEGKE